MDQKVKAILVEVLPDEVDLLGDELVNELLEMKGVPKHLNLPGVDQLNIAPVYDFLKAAAGVVTKLINEYDAWKIKHATSKFKVNVDGFLIEYSGSDPAIKAAIAKSLPRLIAVVEARQNSQRLD